MKFFLISLLPLGGNKEKESFETLKNLSDSVVETVTKFKEGVEAYAEQDYERGENILKAVDELESEADGFGLEFESKLGEGAFLPAFRGDLSRLAESIDDTADMAEEAIREIHRRPKVFRALAEAEERNEDLKSLRTGLVDLAGKAVESAQSQDEAVSLLMKDMNQAAKKAEEIHLRERESDDKEDQLAMTVHEHEDLLDPLTVMQIRGLIDRFGGISDSAEKSGDIISAMTHALKV